MESNISFTTQAADQITELLQGQDRDDLHLRVYVSGGGCSGFQYGFKFDENINDDDTIVQQHNIKILIDSMSIGYLQGSSIDYVTGIMGSHFDIKNPNATSVCGCNKSFTV